MGIFCSWNISLLMLSEAAQTTFSVNRIIEFKLRWSNAKTPKISLPDSLDLKMLRNWRKPSENCKGQKVALWEKNLNFSRYFSVFFSWDFLSQTFSLIKCAWKVKRTSQVQGSIFSWNQIYLKNQSIVFRTLTKQLMTGSHDMKNVNFLAGIVILLFACY